MSTSRRRTPARRGSVLLYIIFGLPVLIGMAVLSVDVGRVALARSQLQAVADSASRYAAVGAVTSSTKAATAAAQVAAVCAENRVDGRVVVSSSSDVEVGNWTAATRTFTPDTNGTAVRVTLRVQIGGTNSARLFAETFGCSPRTVVAQSIAVATAVETEVAVPSKGNIWLSGMPYNTTSTNLQGDTVRYDNSGTAADPKQRPLEVSLSSLGLAPGDLVSFEGLSGMGSNGAGAADTGPDGQTDFIVSLGSTSPPLPTNSLNGIANARAPLAGVMAVFQTAAAPDASAAPTGLDFKSESQRDYTLLEPLNKQPFFVGDGKTSGGEVQKIRVPAGATRIFLGMMDAWQWNDNTGTFRMKFYRSANVKTVK